MRLEIKLFNHRILELKIITLKVNCYHLGILNPKIEEISKKSIKKIK